MVSPNKVDTGLQGLKRKNDDPIDQVKGLQPKLPKNIVTHHEAYKKRFGIHDGNRYGILDDDDNGDDLTSKVDMVRSFPPIVIANQLKNVKETHTTIKKWVKKVHFKITAAGLQQVITYTSTDYEEVKKKLQDCGLEFFSFTPRAERVKSLVLKGIDPGYSAEEILTDLQSQCDDIINITQMKSKRSGVERSLNMYMVTVRAKADLNTLKRSIQ